MSKKTKVNSRYKHDHMGQTVVNFYNHGTVNIDARQNNSRTYKYENNGCTINSPDYAAIRKHTEVVRITEKADVVAACKIVDFIANISNLK